MAIYEEIAELASDINQQIDSYLDPDTLVYLIESFIEDEIPFTELSIGEIAEAVFSLILVSEAFHSGLNGLFLEEIEEEALDLVDALDLDPDSLWFEVQE
jgi:hypothetical protein